MTSPTVLTPAPTGASSTLGARIGLVLFGLLSLADIATPFVTDGSHPPISISVISAVLGVISLVLVVQAWRGRHRAVIPLVVTRILSAASAVPAFFGGVPAPAVLAAAAIVVVTTVGVILVVPARVSARASR